MNLKVDELILLLGTKKPIGTWPNGVVTESVSSLSGNSKSVIYSFICHKCEFKSLG